MRQLRATGMRRSFIGLVSACLLAVGCDTQGSSSPAVVQGTTVVDAGLEMTVERTTMRNTLGPTNFYGPWVVVVVHVVNHSDRPVYFNPMIQELIIDGDAFEPNAGAAEDFAGDMTSAASLTPGRVANVALAFSVGNDAIAFARRAGQLVLRGALESKGNTVELKDVVKLCTSSGRQRCNAKRRRT